MMAGTWLPLVSAIAAATNLGRNPNRLRPYAPLLGKNRRARPEKKARRKRVQASQRRNRT